MAEEITDDVLDSLNEEADGEKKSRGSLLGNKKIKILALLVLVMGVEAGAMLLLLPAASSKGSSGTGEKEEADEDEETMVVEIGKFQYPNKRAAAAPTYVKFTLKAKIAKSQEVDFLQKAKKDYEAEVHEVVQSIILAADAPELEDPMHVAICNKLREEINKIIKKSYIKRIILNDWSAVMR